MATRHEDWKEAHAAAVKLARTCQHDAVIRKVREFGRNGYNVSLACRADSDYATGEVVKPTDPE